MNGENKITDLLDELKEIVKTLCEISCIQSDYRSKLSKRLNECIEDAVLAEFRRLYGLYLEKIEPEAETQSYILGLKNGLTVPRKKRKWYSFWKISSNGAADLLDDMLGRTENGLYEELARRAAGTLGDPPENAAHRSEEAPGVGPGEVWEENDETNIHEQTLTDPA